MLRRVVLALSALALWAPASLHAQGAGPSAEDIRVAGEEFDLGKQSYKRGAWAEAAEHFEKADARAPSAVALEWAMRARDRAGQLDRAATLAGLLLARHSDQAEPVKAASAIIRSAKRDLHQLIVHCTPACDVVVGTKLAHGAPATERTLYLAPGGVAIHASWPGDRTRSAPVKAFKGGSSEISFEAPGESSAETSAAGQKQDDAGVVGAATTKSPNADQGTESGPSRGLPPMVFFVGAGLTVLAGGVTIWSGIDTQNNPGQDTVREKCAGKGTSCPEYQDGLDRQRRTNVLLGVTAGLAVATGVVGALFTDWSGPKKKASVGPWLGAGALGAQGRF